VTGATLSTADFYYGVVQALGEAQTAQKQFVATLKKSLA
jgi:major membrane immunogen (membrane-anchored lipoprotein)